MKQFDNKEPVKVVFNDSDIPVRTLEPGWKATDRGVCGESSGVIHFYPWTSVFKLEQGR